MPSDAVMTNVLEAVPDDAGVPYLSFSVRGIAWELSRPLNASTAPRDLCTFQSERLSVTRQIAGRFATELTSRDDLILAALSLALLFVIEGILTAVLLRTDRGAASSLGFSVRQFLDLARDFRFRSLFVVPLRSAPPSALHPAAPAPRAPRALNYRLLAFAAAVLLLTSALEAAILFLSTPNPIDVTNRQVSFTLVETLRPDWNLVRDHVGAAAVKPCTSIILEGVTQGNTRINPCLTASGAVERPDPFQLVDDDVDFQFQSRVHEFGAEHTITIAGEVAHYSARVYFTLGDRRRKLLRKRTHFFQRPARTAYLHRQFLAYLFNHYVRKTNDTRMNFARLNATDWHFEFDMNDQLPIIQLNRENVFRMVSAIKYTTKARGVFPRGPEAFRLGAAVLKASTGVRVTFPDLNDFDMGSGSTWPREALMWREESRVLNWFGLLVVLAAAIALYACLRFLLKPIGTAEIAGVWVGRKVGAEEGRGPAFMRLDESKFFKVEWDDTEDDDYSSGGTNWGSGSLV